MISEYLEVALQTARFEILDDGSHYGEIPEMPGVWPRRNLRRLAMSN